MNNRKIHDLDTYCRGCITLLHHINIIRQQELSRVIPAMINNFSAIQSKKENPEKYIGNLRMLMERQPDPGLADGEKQLINHALNCIELLLKLKTIVQVTLLDEEPKKELWRKVNNDLIAEDKKTNPMHILEIAKPKRYIPKIYPTPLASEIKIHTKKKPATVIKKYGTRKVTGVVQHGIYNKNKHKLSPRSAEKPTPPGKRSKDK